MISKPMNTNAPAANEPKLKSDGVWVDDSFKALPVDFIDRTILSLLRNLSKGGFVSVSAIAEKLDMARGTISTRIARLHEAGWVKRLMLNKRKVQVVLTRKTLDLIKAYKAHRQALKQAREQEAADTKAQMEAQKKAEFEVFGQSDQPEPPAPGLTIQTGAHPPPIKPDPVQFIPEDKKQKLIDRFNASWLKGGQSVQSLVDNVGDYVDYCLFKGGMPSTEGCRNRLEACMMKVKKSEMAYLQSIELTEAKQELNQAKIGKMRATTNAYDSENVRVSGGGISYY